MPQPVPPVPGIPAGWHPVQADLDLWVTNSFSFLAQMPAFRGELHAAATVSSWTLAALDTVPEDPYGGWSAVATANQPAFSWLCPAGCGGWYEASLSGFLAAQSGATNQAVAALYLNGAVWQYAGDDWADNGLPSGTGGPAVVPLQPGDYVQLYLYATASTTAAATAGRYPSMELAWVSS